MIRALTFIWIPMENVKNICVRGSIFFLSWRKIFSQVGKNISSVSLEARLYGEM